MNTLDLDALELAACVPAPVDANGFNPNVTLPFGLDADAIRKAMDSYIDFLGFLNQQLHTRGIERLEAMLMAANFSSIVSEFMTFNIPKHTTALVKNRYHNGHPDLIPAGRYPNNAMQHDRDGIEIKASRYQRGWQGHNAEDCWLMVLCLMATAPPTQIKGFCPNLSRSRPFTGRSWRKRIGNFPGGRRQAAGQSRRALPRPAITK